MIVTVALFAFAWLCFLVVAVSLCVIAKRGDTAATRAINGWRNEPS